MLIDASTIQPDDTLNCDICIVGSGAAGIAIANELDGISTKVILLESGSLKYKKSYQELNQGEVAIGNHPPLERDRRRVFGGTTTIWGGRCVPFDAIDFEQRNYVKYSGWPITKTDLDPYYIRAHSYLDLGSYNYDFFYESNKSIFFQDQIHNILSSGNDILETYYRFSIPTNFNHKYLNVLKRSKNVIVVSNATCLYLESQNEKEYIEKILGSTLSQKRFYVKANCFVLATGGLETTKLLLLSNIVNNTSKFGNENLLGKFYMGHLNYKIDIQYFDSIRWDYRINNEGIYFQPAFAISNGTQKRNKLLNLRVVIDRPDTKNPQHKSSVLSSIYLVQKLSTGVLKFSESIDHFKNLVIDFKSLPGFTYRILTKQLLSSRKLPSVIFNNGSNCYTYRIDSEQAPNPQSYLSLSRQKDKFNLNQIQVNWNFTHQDVSSAQKSVELIDRFLQNNQCGKVISFPTCPTIAGGHHLGTTRMGTSPTNGIVDENCQVFGISNLFISSGSIFTTSSYANPTLTIVALALRLADHLKSR